MRHTKKLGALSLAAALTALAEQGIQMIYDETHMVLAQGNYVLAVSEGTYGGAPTSYYDLWRVENGKIAEHWDVMETIADASTWQNGNGKTFTYIGGFPAWAYKYTQHAGGADGGQEVCTALAVEQPHAHGKQHEHTFDEQQHAKYLEQEFVVERSGHGLSYKLQATSYKLRVTRYPCSL